MIRLTGAVLIHIDDDWKAAERRYSSDASVVRHYPEREDELAVVGELAAPD